MAGITRLDTKKGPCYRISVSRGRGLSPYTRRWYPDPGWSRRKTERELQKAASAFEADCAAGKVLTREEKRQAAGAAAAERARKPTLRRYAEEVYLPRRAQELSWNTMRSLRQSMEIHILPALGDMLLEEITVQDVTRFSAGLRKNLSWTSAGTVFSHLSGLLADACRSGVIPANPASAAGRPKASKEERAASRAAADSRALTAEELPAVLDALEREPLRWRVFFHLGLDGGLRLGEILALTWDLVDFDAGSVSVRRSLQQRTGECVAAAPKSVSAIRDVTLGEETMDLLRALRREQRGQGRWVLPSVRRPDRPTPPATAEKWLQRFGQRCGHPGLHPHMLRHTAASLAIAGGADVAGVSRRLGHATMSTTMNTYIHADTAAASRAGEAARKVLAEARQNRQAE